MHEFLEAKFDSENSTSYSHSIKKGKSAKRTRPNWKNSMLLSTCLAQICLCAIIFGECLVEIDDCPENFGVMARNIPCSFISFFLHIKDIICHFCSLLDNSGHFKFTSTLSTTVLLVELMPINHGRHVVSCSYWQPRGGCFSYFAMRPTLFNASNNTSSANLLISYHFKC